jgi:hypothetical protein
MVVQLLDLKKIKKIIVIVIKFVLDFLLKSLPLKKQGRRARGNLLIMNK